MLCLILFSVSARAALSPDAATLIQQAGNTQDDRDREKLLERLASLETIEPTLRQETTALLEYVRRWNTSGLKFYNTSTRGKPPQAIGDYDFGVSPDSPLFPITAIYRGRMLAWNLIENSTVRTHPKLAPWFKDEAVKSFRIAAAAFPDNPIPRMYLGEPIPWPKTLSSAPNAPAWAALQREQLERLRDIILWWIDNRQKSDGQFGGGWGDDCEMWRWWSSVLLGFDDAKIRNAQIKFSRSAVSQKHLKGGFNTELTDVEHAAEDTTDNLVPLLVLQGDEPRWQEWSRRLVDFMQNVWTAPNQRGQRQFKSFYFSATETSPTPHRQFDVMANVAAIHPALMIWQQTRDPRLGAPILAWLDTWIDAAARAENGKPAGILPASIRWPDGAVAGSAGNWWEPVKPGAFMYGYYLWPSVITEMTDAMVIAYLNTGNEKYLAPIRSLAAIRLRHLKNPPAAPPAPGTEAWCARQLAPRHNANSNIGFFVKTLARLKALTGTTEFDELLNLEGGEFVISNTPIGRQQLEAALRESVEALRINFPGFTGEVRSTDRVLRFCQFLARDYRFDEYLGVTLPKHELLYRMVSGDTNAPRLPLMAVRWLTPPTDIAALVTASSRTRFEAELFHFGATPRPVTAQLRLLAPGEYQPILLVNNTSTKLPPLKVEAGRFATLPFELPPQTLCILRIEPCRH